MPGQNRTIPLDNDGRAASYERFIADAAHPMLQVGTHRGEKARRDAVTIDLHDDECDWQCDVQDLPFAVASYGSACCHAVLEHVPDPITSLTELARVVIPNGLLHVEVPWNQGLHYKSPWLDFWRITTFGMDAWLRQTGWAPLEVGWFGEPDYASVYALAQRSGHVLGGARWSPPS